MRFDYWVCDYGKGMFVLFMADSLTPQERAWEGAIAGPMPEFAAVAVRWLCRRLWTLRTLLRALEA